jgi:branched-chain amino acid transport system substrate-binding protein
MVLKSSDPIKYGVTLSRTDREVSALLTYAKEKLGIKRLAIVTEEEPFFTFIRKIFQEESKKVGIELVTDVSVNPGETDMKSITVKMKASQPDAIFFGFVDTRAIVNFGKARIQFLPKTLIIGTHDLSGLVEADEYKQYFDNSIYTKFKVSDSKFNQRFKERFGHDPILNAPFAYDAAKILLTLLKQGLRTPTEIRKGLVEQEFDTISYGKVRFNKEGKLDVGEFEIHQFLDGKFQLLKP